MTTRNIEDLRKEVAAHIEADALVRGQYWKGDVLPLLYRVEDMADLIAKQAKVIESLVAAIKECGEIGKDGYGSSYIICHNCVTIYEKTEAALAAYRALIAQEEGK